MPTSIIPPKTISAVDATANTITVVAHGLVTGDTFLGIWSPDGGSPPAPILETDDLWAIRVDDDTLKLASSSALAMAGTAIDITDTGSGTLKLVQGAPYRRPRIFANGSQLPSKDLNQAFESIQDDWERLFVESTVLPVSPHGWTPLDGDESLFHPNPAFFELDAGGNARKSIEIPEGYAIVGVTWYASRTSGVLSGELTKIDNTGNETTVTPVSGSTSDNSTSGMLTLAAGYREIVTSAAGYQLRATSDAAAAQFMRARVAYRRAG